MSCLKNQDLFGHKVQFSFNNQSSHKTAFGGLISVIVKLLIFCFVGQKLYSIGLRSDSKIRTHTYLQDSNSNILYNETGMTVYHALFKNKANNSPVFLNSSAN